MNVLTLDEMADSLKSVISKLAAVGYANGLPTTEEADLKSGALLVVGAGISTATGIKVMWTIPHTASSCTI